MTETRRGGKRHHWNGDHTGALCGKRFVEGKVLKFPEPHAQRVTCRKCLKKAGAL